MSTVLITGASSGIGAGLAKSFAADGHTVIACGRDPATPAVVVENASLPAERHVLTTLAGLAAACADVHAPAVLIIGETAALAAEAAPEAVPGIAPQKRAGSA